MPAERIPTVLMLDDEKFLLEMYKIALEKRGFEVSAFHRADDALNALRAGFDPDIILFDITIPDSRSGYEFLEIIRKEQLAKSSLKVALTNEGQEAGKMRMTELGADAHLLKAQYIPSEIVTALNELLHSKKQ